MVVRIKIICLIIFGMIIIQAGLVHSKTKGLRKTRLDELTGIEVQTVNIPPPGELPDDVFISFNRYWILQNYSPNSNQSLYFTLDYNGLCGSFDETKIIVLSRLDSSKKWSKTTHYTIRSGHSAVDGFGAVKLKVDNPQPGAEFALARFTSRFPSNQPAELSASINYGPIAISWQTQNESETKYFVIERKIKNQTWVEIGSVTAAGFSAFPQTYHFEDISSFPEGTQLKYRIKQINLNCPPTISLPIELDYSPLTYQSRFAQAIQDTIENAIQIKFGSSMSGLLRIDLFTEEMHHRACLIEKAIVPGIYACNIQSSMLKQKPLVGAAFCRLEIVSPAQGKSFIQIRQVSHKRVF